MFQKLLTIQSFQILTLANKITSFLMTCSQVLIINNETEIVLPNDTNNLNNLMEEI